MPRDKIVFQANVPVEVALEFAEGKLIESQNGWGDQYYYSLTENRCMYVPPVVVTQLNDLEIQLGEPVAIVKTITRQAKEPGDKRLYAVTRWIVRRVEGSGTLAVQKVGQEAKGSSPSPAPPPHTAIPQPKESPTAQPSETITAPRRERWVELLTDAVEAVKETSARTGRQFDGKEFQDIISTLVIDQQRRDEMDLRYFRAVPSTTGPRAHVPQTNGHTNGAVPWHQ